MASLYVPAASVLGVTETLMAPGVVPLAAAAANHAPPPVAIVKGVALPPAAMEMACGPGIGEPI